MKLQLHTEVENIPSGSWDKFLAGHPYGNYFQSRTVYDLFLHIKEYTPVINAVTDNNGEVVGILLAVIQKESSGIAGVFSARSIVWGGPVVHDNDTGIINLLLKGYDEQVSGKVIYSQFRNLYDLSFCIDSFNTSGFKYLQHLNYKVDCTGTEEQVLQRMSKSKARQVKKAMASGVQIVKAENENDVLIFYGLLKTLYRTKVGKPLPPYGFFKMFFEKECSTGSGVYLLVKYNNEITGGIMCPVFGNKTIYEWYIAADDVKYKHLYPGVMATWAAIQYANQHNISEFDFLGAGKPEEDYGVREFKSKFGGELFNYGRFEKIHKPLLMSVGKIGLKILNYIRN